MEPIKFSSKLIEENKVNGETAIMKFSTPENFDFKPGQYVNIAFYKDGKRIIRSYSIFSPPKNKKFLKIYFKRVDGGYCSNVLFNLKVGDEIEMKGPYGDFTIRDKKRDVILISSGTGFSPFKSMILDLLEGKSFRGNLILIRGHRNEDNLPCEGRLKGLERENKNFRHYNVLSQPKDEKYPFKGHVQDFLEKLVPKDFQGDFYICGLEDMVPEVRKKLRGMGFSPERIFFERYD